MGSGRQAASVLGGERLGGRAKNRNKKVLSQQGGEELVAFHRVAGQAARRPTLLLEPMEAMCVDGQYPAGGRQKIALSYGHISTIGKITPVW